MNITGKIFNYTLLLIAIAEVLSFFGYLVPKLGTASFIVIVVIFLTAAIYKFEYALLIALTELIIGSKGYLFFIEIGNTPLSIRIVFWIIIMSVWFGKIISKASARDKKFIKLHVDIYKKTHLLPYFFYLFIFIFWGLLNGLMRQNSFSNIFFDINGWLYFSLIFPIYETLLESKKFLQSIIHILFASIVWICVKTYFLLFAFSHNMENLTGDLYSWVRTTGVGEITRVEGGFPRIFFQSHIFILIGLFLIAILSIQQLKIKKIKNLRFMMLFAIVSSLLSVSLISYSRSNWVGLAFGFVVFGAFIFWVYGLKKVAISTVYFLSTLLIGFFIVNVLVKFPYPNPVNGINTQDVFKARVTKINDESAVSSRKTLLPKMWNEIKKDPIFGQGYGKTITYKSSDPRIRETSIDGTYTTYAFEWGWLDIWLKLGIFGLLAYIQIILFIGYIVIKNLKKRGLDLNIGLFLGLAVLSVISIFSPYMNHPLGIGYLILVGAILETKIT